MKTTKASDISLRHLSVLLVGDPGSGKSHFIASMPKPLLVLNFDNKAAITYNRAPEAKDIELINLEDNLDRPEAVLDMDCALDELAAITNFPYATVALDSLTNYSLAEMRRAITVNGSSGGKRIGGSGGKAVVPTLTDHLLWGAKIEYMLSKLLALPCHIAVTAHEMSVEDKNGGLVRIIASLCSGKKTLIRRLPGKFSCCFHPEQFEDTATGLTAYRVRCRGNELYSWCKNTIGLPDIITGGWAEVEAYLEGDSA